MVTTAPHDPYKKQREKLKRANWVDLCFLVDITLSMDTSIKAVRDTVTHVLDEVKKTQDGFVGKVRYSFVGYRDYDDAERFVVLDFVEDPEEVSDFLETIKAIGGGDIPEDVLGGLEKVNGLNWFCDTRTLIHICDAPGHGLLPPQDPNLDDSMRIIDNYPNGNKSDLGIESRYKEVLEVMCDLKIDYYLFPLSHTEFVCEVMKNLFKSIIESNNGIYSCESLNIAQLDSKKIEMEVLSKITKSLRTSTRLSQLRRQRVKPVKPEVKESSEEDEDSEKKKESFEEDSLPSWEEKKESSDENGDSEETKGSAEVEEASEEKSEPVLDDQKSFRARFSGVPKVAGHLTSFIVPIEQQRVNKVNIVEYLTKLTDDEQLQHTTIGFDVQYSLRPEFLIAQGGERTAYVAYHPSFQLPFVIKQYNEAEKNTRDYFMQAIKVQEVARALAEEFNQNDNVYFGLEFVDLRLLTVTEDGKEQTYMIEPYIPGKYVKYFDNTGIHEEDLLHVMQTLTAFAHWTYERSNRSLVVVDIQGVNHRLTDPAIHSTDQIYGDCDLGEEGIDMFLDTHVCSELCRSLGLPLLNVDDEDEELAPATEHASAPQQKIYYCRGLCCGNEIPEDQLSDIKFPFCENCKKREKMNTVKRTCKYKVFPDTCRFGKKCKRTGCKLSHHCKFFEAGNCNKTESQCTHFHVKPQTKTCGVKFEVSFWYCHSKNISPPKRCYDHRGTAKTRSYQTRFIEGTAPYNAMETETSSDGLNRRGIANNRGRGNMNKRGGGSNEGSPNRRGNGNNRGNSNNRGSDEGGPKRGKANNRGKAKTEQSSSIDSPALDRHSTDSPSGATKKKGKPNNKGKQKNKPKPATLTNYLEGHAVEIIGVQFVLVIVLLLVVVFK